MLFNEQSTNTLSNMFRSDLDIVDGSTMHRWYHGSWFQEEDSQEIYKLVGIGGEEEGDWYFEFRRLSDGEYLNFEKHERRDWLLSLSVVPPQHGMFTLSSKHVVMGKRMLVPVYLSRVDEVQYTKGFNDNSHNFCYLKDLAYADLPRDTWSFLSTITEQRFFNVGEAFRMVKDREIVGAAIGEDLAIAATYRYASPALVYKDVVAGYFKSEYRVKLRSAEAMLSEKLESLGIRAVS